MSSSSQLSLSTSTSTSSFVLVTDSDSDLVVVSSDEDDDSVATSNSDLVVVTSDEDDDSVAAIDQDNGYNEDEDEEYDEHDDVFTARDEDEYDSDDEIPISSDEDEGNEQVITKLLKSISSDPPQRRLSTPKSPFHLHNIDTNPSSFPACVPPKVAHIIFGFLDRSALHSVLTVSKHWFLFAADHLYRDPFQSRTRTDFDFIEELVPSLRASQEQLLVRLLLQSINCPSVPGEEVVLASDDRDGLFGHCHLVDVAGDEVRTTVNYMRLLEVFDWAPWQRYLDFWDTISNVHSQLPEETEKVADENENEEEADSGDAEDTTEHDAKPTKDESISHANDDDGDDSAMSNDKTEGKGDNQATAQINARPFHDTLVKFSYGTILDWFAENPNATTVVMHPDAKFPFQIATQLPRWTTLCFEQALPEKYRDPQHLLRYDHISLLQGIIDHRFITEDDPKGGIRHLQLPPPFYFDLEKHWDEIAILMGAMPRPLSLDVSGFSDWANDSFAIQDGHWKDLVRFVCMNCQNGPTSIYEFLWRCPNLKEIEMVVQHVSDIDFRSSHFIQEDSTNDYSIFQNQFRTAIPKLSVARLYSTTTDKLGAILRTILAVFSNSLRVFKLDITEVECHAALYMNPVDQPIGRDSFQMPLLEDLHLFLPLRTQLHGYEPFEGCPRLQRLTLRSNESLPALGCWKAPSGLRELVLEGRGLIESLDLGSLGYVRRLELLALLQGHEPYSKCQMGFSHQILEWPAYTYLPHLKTLQLSGFAARSFQFSWLSYFPALENLNVDGLDSDRAVEVHHQHTTNPSSQSRDRARCTIETQGPRICKFKMLNPEPSEELLMAKDFMDMIVRDWSTDEQQQSDTGNDSDQDQSQDNSSVWLNQPLFSTLRRFCPRARHLTLDFASSLSSTESDGTHMDHELEVLSKLKRDFPELTRFGTDSFMIMGETRENMGKHGFIRRQEPKWMRYPGLPTAVQWEDCVYRFGEVEYVRRIEN
ncbi:hypothetical protein BG011_005259 [Mortierella polycephala]|uniref:F-box domain-containing protein n=1 Tax=Mortierella polycephala TaxID=41804 RepID=A0A9P6QG77_9FUNG|nr:hypothetical protein BG011_005259 [Mortierella polycephala]